MTHEQGLTGDDQPRAPGESVNETAADLGVKWWKQRVDVRMLRVG